MKTILRAVITFFVCVCHTVLDTVSMLNKKRIPIFSAMTNKKSVIKRSVLRAIALQDLLLSLKFHFSLSTFHIALLIAFSLFLAAPKTNAQTSVNNFADFIAITTTTNNYDISLTGDIFFSGGNFNILSGAITGNGYALDGQNVNAGVLLTSGNNLFFYGPITFQNFSKASANYGKASQGGALFVAGAYNVYLDSATILNFASSTINFAGNTVISGGEGTASQGGGLFVGGAVAAGRSYAGANNSSSATAVVNFTSSTVNFASNTVISGGDGAAAQGGGLFVGGAVAAGAFDAGANNSSSGTAVVNFTSSTINFTSNTVISGDYGTAAQGGGLFVGGAVSAGTYYYGISNASSGTAVVNFTSSTINFTSNTVASGLYGAAVQGGGLFVGGAVAAGAKSNAVNNSSSATAVVNFTLSTVNFASNTVINGGYGTAAQGGGLFVGGAVAVGVYNDGANNASSATAVVNFTSSTINFAGNTVISGDEGTASQGGGLFVGGAVAAVILYGVNDSSSATAVVNFTSSTVSFANNTVTSGNNGTAAQGGGLFVGGAVAAVVAGSGANNASSGTAVVNFTSSTINFTSNTVTSGGNGSASQGGGLFVGGAVSAGAVYGAANYSSSGTATVTFTNSIVNIGNNVAQDGGGLFVGGSVSTGAYTNGVNTATNGIAQATFTGSTVTIIGNAASASGGGIYIAGNYGAGATDGQASLIFENTKVTIASNTAQQGAAIYAVNRASVVFNNTNIEFLWNKSAAGNGVVYWDTSSYVGLENAKITKAIGNQANNGGFLYLVNGVTVTFAGTATFDGNKASVNGGALYITGNTSQIIFADGSTITFTNNNAAQGGAVYATAGANVVFTTGAHYVVSNNTATYGGFIAVNNATATFKSGVDFSLSNSSATYGGFLYATNNAIANFENIYASSNSAALGGFAAAESGAVINIGSAVITGNVATSSGGAIYLQTSTANFNSATGAIVFASNTANGKANDIYAAGSFINFNAENNQIRIEDGIYIGAGGNNTISKTGLGELYISGNNYIQGAFNQTAGTTLIEKATWTFENGNWNVTTSSGVRITSSVVTVANTVITSFTYNSFAAGVSSITNANARALTLNASAAVFDGNMYFSSNTSAMMVNGGAVGIYSSSVQFNGYASFVGNTATGGRLTFSNNGANGGAIYAQNSVIEFNGKSNFAGNSAQRATTGADGNGSGIYALNSQIYFNEISSFTGQLGGNSQYGGAIYIEQSTIVFNKGAYFESNVSMGAGIYSSGSYVSFRNSPVAFFNNTAGDYNQSGALYVRQGSLIEFVGADANFTNNKSQHGGGAIYLLAGSTMTFSNNNVVFSSNTDNTSGGAIYSNGLILFNAAQVLFADNKVANGSSMAPVRGLGGAIIIRAGGEIDFIGSSVAFARNSAYTLGGAIYADAGSTITFASAPAIFDDNVAESSGGAIYSNLANITFNNGNATFTNNKALTGSGGAIYAVDDLVFDGANVDFTGNEALSGNGGAIFADDTILTIKNAVMTFMNNKALLGGAVYASNNSNITLSGRGSFIGNEANASGAAVYVTGGSTVTLEAASGDILFTGNKAAGTPNDIYADNNSRLNLITGGTNTISIAGGILSNTAGTAIEVNKTGTGTLFMGGDNEIWGDFTATAGKVVLLESATFKANNIIFNGAELDMTDADLYDNLHVNVATATTMFASNTSLLMDIFENGNNDQIFASSAQIGGNLQIKAHFGVYNNQEYHLIMSSENAINGTFANATFVYVGTGAFSYQVKYNDITDWTGVVRIIVNGINKGDFQNLPKLTFNQSEVAKTWDELSIILPTNDLKEIMEATANLSDQEEQKKVLAIASGYFHSNVIKSAALDSDNNELYDRIKNHSTREHTNSAIWAQVTGGNTKLGGDENSLGEYKDNRYGVMAGFDIYFGSMSSINKTMLGIYVNYKDQSMNQEASKATLNKIGGGLYGGYIEESYEIKAMIGGSKDSYETTRNIAISQYLPVPPYADRNAKANYEGFTLGADVEGALKYKIGNNTNFRPYAGAELKNVSYDGFTETGANGLNLKVEAGNYLRTTARVGAGVNYDDKTWAGYVNLEGKYLLTGKKYEIESVFEGTEVKFLSRGYEENGLILGATLGGSVRITEGLKFFINANAHTAEKFTNLYANAGLRYNFCGITHKEKEEPVVEKAAPAPVVVEQPKPEIEEQAKPAVEAGKKQIQPYRSRAVNFDTNKYLLKSNHISSIKEHADYIKQHDYNKVVIEGHTDSTGNEKVNQPLSERRAQSVYNELANNGIPKEKMEIVGHSSKNPVDTNKTKEGRANNRRTEIVVE
ncbi:OmpA family protein [Endomicrobium proavitum]|uniref:Autotransporter domain-containing protein n=1 Tax=Endomicrobium proavitum TaxID=1408281 RepID=A0A0G3WIP6_9BACT|nr:OmpA family protein [Endomicrobium proavitum]AKL97752.1 hypothetical protein Epro_0373 [Endomicrobium proavitum]